MIIKRNGNPRIVTDKGKIIVEFSKDGIANVDRKVGAKLMKFGYSEVKEQSTANPTSDVDVIETPTETDGGVADAPSETDGGEVDDTSGETEAQTSGSE